MVAHYNFDMHFLNDQLSWFLHTVWIKGPTSFFCIYLSSTIGWKDYPFSIGTCSWLLCWNSVDHKCMGLFLDSLNFMPLVIRSMLVPVSHCLDYNCFAVNFKIGTYESSHFALSQDCFLTILVPWNFMWILQFSG